MTTAEKNVVSIETAARLRSAGFPQRTSLLVWPRAKRLGLSLRRSETGTGNGYVAIAGDDAPTAEEIADQLPTKFNVAPETIGEQIYPLTVVKGIFGWDAHYGEGENPYKGLGAFEYPTMAEALAALWLKLQEAK